RPGAGAARGPDRVLPAPGLHRAPGADQGPRVQPDDAARRGADTGGNRCGLVRPRLSADGGGHQTRGPVGAVPGGDKGRPVPVGNAETAGAVPPARGGGGKGGRPGGAGNEPEARDAETSAREASERQVSRREAG